MEPAVTLRYARQQNRWTRRRTTALALLILLGLGGSYGGYRAYENIRARVEFISTHPQLSMVDWPTVLRSSALRALAWGFSSDPAAISRFQQQPEGMAGLSLFGTDPYGVHVDIRSPLSYVDGRLELRLLLTNLSTRTVPIPPFRQQWRPSSKQNSLMVSARANRGWFSRGVHLLEPGATTTETLSIRAPVQPVPLYVFISTATPGGWLLGTPFPRDLWPGWDTWEDVPPNALRTLLTPGEWESTPIRVPRHMLFPDERRPRPWETEYLP